MTNVTYEKPAIIRCHPHEHGSADHASHLLEQYKLLVDSAIKVTEWRQSANNYLLAVNTFLVTLYGLAASLQNAQPWRHAVAGAGMIVCLVWFVLIVSYKELNSAKFTVIHELEADLPAALFAREWAVIKQRNVYLKLTHVEMWIPLIFAALYVILAVFTLFTAP